MSTEGIKQAKTAVVVGDETITYTSEQRDSVEVTQDAKGQFKYVVKLYFDRLVEGEASVVEAAGEVHARLVRTFEGGGV